MVYAIYQDKLVRVLVKSTKNCRVTFDTNNQQHEGEGFLIPTEELKILVAHPDRIKAVREHAKANYEKDGWDYIVETYTDEDIAKEVKNCKNNESAIKKMARIAKLLNEKRKEIQATAY